MTVEKHPATLIDDYITGCAPEVQPLLEQMRAIIRQAAPDAEEAISYGMPTFRLHGNLVHFAANKQHIGFYPTPSAIVRFQAELAPYVSSKGAVQFPLTTPLPEDLISRMVAFRVEENRARAAARKKPPRKIG